MDPTAYRSFTSVMKQAEQPRHTPEQMDTMDETSNNVDRTTDPLWMYGSVPTRGNAQTEQQIGNDDLRTDRGWSAGASNTAPQPTVPGEMHWLSGEETPASMQSSTLWSTRDEEV